MGGEAASADENALKLSEKKQQFRTVRRAGYAGLGVVVLVLLYLVWVQNGGSGDPLFIPLPQLMFVMLLGAFVLNLTSVVFGALEVHAASSGEQRYLIARHGYSTGIVTAAFAAFFLVIIALLGPVIDAQIDYEKQLGLGIRSIGSTVTAPFDVTSDYTGSSYLAWVEIDSDGLLFSVTVYPHDAYSSVNDSLNVGKEVTRATNVSHFRINFVALAVETTPSANWTTPDWSKLSKPAESERYMIVVERHELELATVTYHQDRQLDPGFVNSVYTLLVLLIGLNAAAAVYNRVVRQKWRAYGEKNY